MIMDKNGGGAAKIKAIDGALAMIGFGAISDEDVNAHGIYSMSATCVKDEHRAEYVRMLEKYHALKDQALSMIRDAHTQAQLDDGAKVNLVNRDLLDQSYLVDREAEALKASHAWMTYERELGEFPNLVTTVGKNDLLDKYLAGSSYTAAWYLGLISSVGWSAVNVADTAASHAGWTESAAYAAGTRPAVAFSAASGGTKTTSSAVSFSINATVTIKGSFLISNNTKSGTTGILYSCGTFTGGDVTLGSGDTLNVTYTAGA